MSHKHKVKLEKLFEHPVSGNIDGRKVLSALEHYGAKVEITKHNKAKIFFRDGELIMALAHHNILTKDTILKLRHFLEDVNFVPGKFE